MMAASDCCPVQFYDSCSDAFYFDAAGITVVDGDYFTDSGQCQTYSLRCKDNKILLLSTTGQFCLRDLTTLEQSRADCRFKIHIFQDNSDTVKPGLPVMLYAIKGDKKMVACCRENNEIYPEEMVFPDIIPQTAHRALFYLTHVTSCKFMFESTTFPSKFLGFTAVDGNVSLKKLVLCSTGPDGVNESSEVTLQPLDG